MLKLRRLKINSYRNVRPGSELHFVDGINILLGLSGSGKTTLLNLLVRLLSSPLNEIDGDNSYDLEFELTFNTGRVDGRISHGGPYDELNLRQVAAKLAMYLDSHSEPYEISYDGENLRVKPFELRAVTGKKTGLLSLLSMISKSYVVATGSYKFNLLSNEFFVGPRHRYEEGLETLARIEQAVHGISRSADTGDVLLNQEGWTIPGLISEFIDIAQNRPDTTEVNVDFSSERGAFLRTFIELTGLAGVTLQFDRIEKRVHGTRSYTSNYGNLRFLIKRHDGSEHYHQKLSRGQKRLLSYLYYKEANRDILVADELVNDLHHAWIEKCIELIPPRQAFLTSQNPLLLDHLVFHSSEEVRHAFVICHSVVIDSGEQLIWRNPDDDEVSAFYRAYEAGVHYVSEILRSKGLW